MAAAEEEQIAAAAAVATEDEEGKKANWSEIPCDILHVIMEKLITGCFISDYIRLGCVCVSWNSAFCHHNPQPLPPLLMIPPSINDKHTTLRTFYNISDKKVIKDKLQVRMPPYRQCRGSSHGWLITVDNDDEKSFPVRLFNPFLSSSSSSRPLLGDLLNVNELEIILPPLKHIPIKTYGNRDYSDLVKAVLSANPLSNPSQFTVMAIYGTSKKLAFFKPGDHKANWTPVKLPRIDEDSRKGDFVDVIYYQGKFLAIDSDGVVVVCDIDHDDDVDYPTARILLEPREINNFCYDIYCRNMYLVESSGGDLFMVHRYTPIKPDREATIYLTLGFKVFKLLLQDHSTSKEVHKDDEEGRGLPKHSYEWVEVKSLCGDTMFLGHNASLCIPANSHVYPGCKPNHIYYTDDTDLFVEDEDSGPHDMGVFNLEDGSFERHFPIDPKNTSVGPSDSIVPIWPVPIWIQPSVPKKIVPTLPVPIWMQPRVPKYNSNNNNDSIFGSLFSGEG